LAPANGDGSWLQLLGQVSPVAIYRGDAEGRCIYVNERWCELSGLPPEAALGSGWERAVHPEDVPLVAEEWVRSLELGVPFSLEYRYCQPSGRIVWVFSQVVEECDALGRLTGYVGICTDITKLRELREKLERSHAELEERIRERTQQWEHMAMIVAASADAIISSDLSNTIISWNHAAEKIFGYAPEEMIGQTSYVITPAEKVEEAKALKARVRRGERVDYVETIRVARSGELIEVGLSIFPLCDAEGKVIGTSAIVRDIREKKKAERRLHQLSGRLLRLQDEERRRLARELHDSTAQSLAALAVNLSLLNQHHKSLSAEKRAHLLADGLQLAESIGSDLRTHAYLLHPPLLDERGLPAALRWLAEGFAARSGIAVDLKLAPDMERLPEQVELTIFRVVQESLSNIHRHSRSAAAWLRLMQAGGWVEIEVRDAGRGLPREAGECLGVGIAGMRERVAQLGGTLLIESKPTGTTVLARIPIL
jgi:PAS domain S-box-containing protein